MGGGLPAAAFGGRAEVMERLAPPGPVYQAGTLSGNPVAMAAGLATLRAADDAVYAKLDANADRLSGLSSDALADAGVAHQVSRAGNMFSVFFTDAPVTDFASAKATETWRFPPFFHALLDAGVYPPPQRVRVVVRLGRARRRRVRPDRLRPARRGARRRRGREAGMTSREDDRARDAARRGAQPGQGALRPTARTSTCRSAVARRRRRRRLVGARRHRLRGGLSAGAGAGDGGADRGGARPDRSTPTTT